MKATELMLGDYVINTEFNKNEIDTIECIEEYRVWLKHGKTYIALEYIQPIPLTIEILQNNGFTLQDSWYRLLSGDDEIAVQLPKGDVIYPYSSIEYIKIIHTPEDVTETEYGSSMTFKGNISVHDLQHAMRLCGINKELMWNQ